MLRTIRAAAKGMLTRRLTYDDLYALVKSLATKTRPLGFLTDSAEESWERVSAAEAGSCIEHWRTEHLTPLLQEIAEQPTHGLQVNTLRRILLDEAAIGKWTVIILRLPKEDAAEALKDYPDPLAAARSLEWKLEHVSLEFFFTSLNEELLLQLGRRGFAVSRAQLEAWADLYTEAYGQIIAQAALLGAGYGMPPRRGIPDGANHEILHTTMSMVATMREDIATGRADVEHNAGRYRRMVEGTRSLLDQ